MTSHERELIHQAFSHQSQEIRAAQRAVEVLANLFESLWRELYPHQASRVWHILNHISGLERIAISPPPPDNEPMINSASLSYRWSWMEHALPTYGMRRLADNLDELSELLSGEKIEEVAEGKGHESYLEYMNKVASPINLKLLNERGERLVNRAVHSREEVDQMLRRGDISEQRAEELLRMSYETKEKK